MDKTLASMIAGIKPEMARILFGGPRRQMFSEIVAALSAKMAAGERIVPPPDRILAAFKEIGEPRVVLVGQDPYQHPGRANGLSFGVSAGQKVPPSLLNIYECLHKSGLLHFIPTCGDLTPLRAQGVLLINSALTTVESIANAHAGLWRQYTDSVLAEISSVYSPAFILLGVEAGKKAALLREGSAIFTWCHPSPMVAVNKIDCPENFINCTAFSEANKYLASAGAGKEPIDYNVLCGDIAVDSALETGPESGESVPPTRENGTVYIFTDGAATGNGKKHARATWGMYVVDGDTEYSENGEVPEVDIPGKKYKSSNNRGELTAIARALEYISSDTRTCPVVIISDSDYGINAVTRWMASWRRDPAKMRGKLNLDLIEPAEVLYEKIKKVRKIEMRHVRSHKDEPADKTTYEWFVWHGNHTADRLCVLDS